MDQQIQLKDISGPFRKVVPLDAGTDLAYGIFANALYIPASTVAKFCKERWQIELFLEWNKQNLCLKTFWELQAMRY